MSWLPPDPDTLSEQPLPSARLQLPMDMSCTVIHPATASKSGFFPILNPPNAIPVQLVKCPNFFGDQMFLKSFETTHKVIFVSKKMSCHQHEACKFIFHRLFFYLQSSCKILLLSAVVFFLSMTFLQAHSEHYLINSKFVT